MTTRRRILLDALDAWRSEGVLDDDAHRFLRARYSHAPTSVELDTELAPVAVGSGSPERSRPETLPATGPVGTDAGRRSFAADSMQFIGGLLVGASFVALTVFLELDERQTPTVLVLLGLLLFAPALAFDLFAERRGAGSASRRSLVEAGLAGAFVPLVVASVTAVFSTEQIAIPLVLVAASAHYFLRAGRAGASTLIASAAFAWGSFATLQVAEDAYGLREAALRWLWLLALLAWGAGLLVWRERGWANVSLGLLVGPVTLASALVMALWGGGSSVALEIGLGLVLGALLALGIWTGARGLVAGAAAGLTIDAIAFAFDVGGPGTAVVVLLALGALLVWQAEFIRGYFRRGDAA